MGLPSWENWNLSMQFTSERELFSFCMRNDICIVYVSPSKWDLLLHAVH